MHGSVHTRVSKLGVCTNAWPSVLQAQSTVPVRCEDGRRSPPGHPVGAPVSPQSPVLVVPVAVGDAPGRAAAPGCRHHHLVLITSC